MTAVRVTPARLRQLATELPGRYTTAMLHGRGYSPEPSSTGYYSTAGHIDAGGGAGAATRHDSPTATWTRDRAGAPHRRHARW